MRFPREYAAYMARQVLKQLTADGLIQYDQPDYVNEVMSQVMIEELSVEDHINDEVRRILDSYDGKMQEMGVSYEEMFKKVKRQIVRDRNVVL